jgi:superfamily II DNA or RNA helicase
MSQEQPVLIKVGNVSLSVEGLDDPEVRDQIRHVLSYIVPGYKYMPQYKKSLHTNNPWDGRMTLALVKGQRLEAPSGLYSYIREVLSENGIPYKTIDLRELAITSSGYAHNISLRDYQGQAKDEGLKRQRGVLKMSTGAGKTETVIATIVEAAVFPAIFYVTSCDLLEQAHDRFLKYVTYNGMPLGPDDIGRVGGGHCNIKPITIATVQSCQLALTGKYTKFDDCDSADKMKLSDIQKAQIKDMVHSAQFVYVDECQHVAAETIQDVLNSSYRARFRIGGSASPWRDDGLDLMIEAAFGRKYADVSASFLIHQGHLLRPHIVFNHFDQKLGPTATFNAHYKKYIVENEPRNLWIAQRAIHHMNLGRPTIILVKWVPHAEALRELIPGAEILTASGDSKLSPKRRKEVLQRMKTKELMCIIGTSLLDEGVDVPSATAGIFAGGGKSSTRELQRVGRFIRRDKDDPNKTCAFIEEFFDHTKWLMNHAKLRRKILETEPQFEITDNRATMSL